MRRGRRLNRRGASPFREEGTNPMEGMGNLSDAMLVLAVGIMLALVSAWNVDIALTNPGDAADATVSAVEDVYDLEDVTIQDSDDAENDTSIPGDGSGLTEYGTVYVDADGNYYVEAKTEGGSEP